MNANAAVLLFLAIDLAIAGVVTYALGVNAKSEGGLKKSRWWGLGLLLLWLTRKYLPIQISWPLKLIG